MNRCILRAIKYEFILHILADICWDNVLTNVFVTCYKCVCEVLCVCVHLYKQVFISKFKRKGIHNNLSNVWCGLDVIYLMRNKIEFTCWNIYSMTGTTSFILLRKSIYVNEETSTKTDAYNVEGGSSGKD